jgi:hypothetical protein
LKAFAFGAGGYEPLWEIHPASAEAVRYHFSLESFAVVRVILQFQKQINLIDIEREVGIGISGSIMCRLKPTGSVNLT